MASDASLGLISGLDRRFAPFAFHFVNAARQAGIPLVVISGRRSGPVADPVGNIAEASLHIPGFAFDVQVLGYLRDDLPWWWWQAMGEYWEAMGGRWGGRFSTPDVNHFDAGVVIV